VIQANCFEAQARWRRYRQVLERFIYLSPDGELCHLSGPKAFSRCLRRTALGLFWEPGRVVGRDPFLCQEDAMILEGIIVAQANDLNAITKREAVDFAYMLKMGRHIKAVDLLRSIGSTELAVELQSQPIEEPDPTWLNLFCERLGISIRSPQQIEAERAQHCTSHKINHFFERFIEILDRSPY
jgi:hypothetical protein